MASVSNERNKSWSFLNNKTEQLKGAPKVLWALKQNELVLEIPSMETIQEMLKDPETIKMRESTGVIVETQKMIKLVE